MLINAVRRVESRGRNVLEKRVENVLYAALGPDVSLEGRLGVLLPGEPQRRSAVRKRLSTPSLGITAENASSSIRTRIQVFQLPLSGSQEIVQLPHQFLTSEPFFQLPLSGSHHNNLVDELFEWLQIGRSLGAREINHFAHSRITSPTVIRIPK